MRIKEFAMADEIPSPAVVGEAETAASADGQEAGTAPGAAESPQESSTKGMLREAIHKVMEEIDHHEREAKRHLAQARALRKDLRESFSFLQERKDDEPIEAPIESRPSVGNETVKPGTLED